MYMSVVREWWRDGVNFHGSSSRRFDGYDARRKRLLNRVDSREYIGTLEKAAADAGVDVGALKSEYLHDPLYEMPK